MAFDSGTCISFGNRSFLDIAARSKRHTVRRTTRAIRHSDGRRANGAVIHDPTDCRGRFPNDVGFFREKVFDAQRKEVIFPSRLQ